VGAAEAAEKNQRGRGVPISLELLTEKLWQKKRIRVEFESQREGSWKKNLGKRA